MIERLEKYKKKKTNKQCSNTQKEYNFIHLQQASIWTSENKSIAVLEYTCDKIFTFGMYAIQSLYWALYIMDISGTRFSLTQIKDTPEMKL